MMHYYKRLLPSQIVRLREGADIVLVLWPLPKSAFEVERYEHDAISKDINTVLDDLIPGRQA